MRDADPVSGSDEDARLTALANLHIVDTAPEQAFDDIAGLAALVLDTECSAVSLIDRDRQWFKSAVGIAMAGTPRDISFCTHVVDAGDMIEVIDARHDPRFSANPLVTGEPGIRFYAGAPLIVEGGHCIGTLCVFDRRERGGVTPLQRQALRDLARLASAMIEARRYRRIGEIAGHIIDTMSDGVMCIDGDGRFTFWNRTAERMFGLTAAQVLGEQYEIVLPPRCVAECRAALAAAGGTTIETTGRRADGEEFPMELSLAGWSTGDGRSAHAAIVRDISARTMLERESVQARTFLDSIVSQLPAMIAVKDLRDGRYLLVNRAGEELLGRPASDVIGRTDAELGNLAGDPGTAGTGEPLRMQFERNLIRHDGRRVTLHTNRIAIDGPEQAGQYLVTLSEDVTERRRAEAEVLRLAHYDTLTGLVNRGSFVERLRQAMEAGTPLALLSIDLDRFKAVNDQFGHLVGDAVLEEVGNRLRGLAGPDDILARVGGDEFMVIAFADDPADRARSLASAIVTALGLPYATPTATVHGGATIGIAVAPGDGRDSRDIRQSSDLALYRAKAHGRGSICFFSAEMDAAARDRRLLERDLREAIAAGHITLAYQPVLSAATGQITSLEALARWEHPTRGPIAPDLFISIAEECGLIVPLGAELLAMACQDAMAWPAYLRVAVNLSPMQFETGDLVATVSAVLARTRLAAHRLQLEVTEGLLIRDVDRTFARLEQLRALGIQILMDDFGVGYSSLSYFERFPFDKVKIDRSFVAKVNVSRAAVAVIQAVVGLGRALGMGIVAEGVETPEQMAALIDAGCTHLQGHLFSRPVPRDRIRHLLAHLGDANARASA